MELVRKLSFSHVLSKPFKGCILIFEYSYFLLQQNGDASSTLDLAVKEYQTSGTQATVLNALQHAIKEHSNHNYDALMQVTVDIIVNNCMCKYPFQDYIKCLMMFASKEAPLTLIIFEGFL